jgi:hypothetical protein
VQTWEEMVGMLLAMESWPESQTLCLKQQMLEADVLPEI